jgi:hypothetical protein
MNTLLPGLAHDPTSTLAEAPEPAVAYFARRDLRNESVAGIQTVWDLPAVKTVIRRQLPSGTWPITASARAGGNPKGHCLVEAYRHLRVLVDQYELDCRHDAVARAMEYVFSHQTEEGDIRGILANQYAPYYTGALLGLAAKAGYADDQRVEAGITWLLSARQADGGWAPGSPGMVGLKGLRTKDIWALTSNPACETARAFDRSKPFSAAATGMVIRAFAAHPRWRRSEEAATAGRLLKSKLLRKDNWSSYQHEDNWLRFGYPYWWTNLVSALEALALLGFTPSDPDVARGLGWLAGHQQQDGLWLTSYSRIHKATSQPPRLDQQLWITLAICRIWRQLHERPT